MGQPRLPSEVIERFMATKQAVELKPRLDAAQAAPGARAAMLGLERYIRECGLETSLLELVRLRASQMNGCAYCIDMHTKDARAEGETEQRLYALSAWRETPFYSERERAALEWTEAVTDVGRSNVPDDVYESVRRHFSETELVNLTMAVIAINGWNRIAVSFRMAPGSYQRPPKT
jgi:AhpD family alkylhydroperoxidase